MRSIFPVDGAVRSRSLTMKFPVAVTIALYGFAATWLPPAGHAQSGAAGGDKLLSSYRDKNRVLLVFAPTPQDDAYLEQMKLWQTEKAGFEDRQLVVMPVFANARKPVPEQSAQILPLMKKHGIEPNAFGVVLVGKDGHDAYHASKPLPAAALYGVIDAMPMRRAEMKRQPAASPTPSPTPRRPDLDHDE